MPQNSKLASFRRRLFCSTRSILTVFSTFRLALLFCSTTRFKWPAASQLYRNSQIATYRTYLTRHSKDT
ncbi:uncharacterized protein BT62DRAFT_373262 [Guyanagaster necrorhizus]|uniref:Uncharacterized protein n=1 Tax=Guyanagaster necrorhizus TaxID=856835 RepID=A0A9P8AP99_9AGAR|nr:uncharacterized protein BT62DRAFT_373262 [Guyanagaster necrorhizus MCA 3950]KAG7442759.1 hypothetical protein BT62DRAFT_373262 [Guyanagaster necrorhizus MCA 3950]